MGSARTDHWDLIFARTEGEGASWFEDEPRTSVAAITSVPGNVTRQADAPS